jgi:ATP-binding cassette, subfamily B, bacterial
MAPGGGTTASAKSSDRGEAADGSAGDEPLGGDAATERPLSFHDIVQQRDPGRRLRRLPSLVRQAFRLVWAAAPGPLLLAGGLQIAAALSLAAQLLVMRRVLDGALIAGGPNLGALAGDLALFGGLLVVVAVAGVAQNEQQRTLGELVQKYTTGRVLDVSTSVELIDYDRPSFHDRLQRARVNASVRPLQIANGIIGVVGSSATLLAVGATVLLIEPLIVAVIVLGGIPPLLLNRLSARVLHRFAVRQTPGDRRRGYLYQILTRKEEAQEVRAFDSSALLREEHDRLFDERIDDLRGVVRQRTIYGAVAGLAAAVVTVGSVLLLLVLVRMGRISISDAAVGLAAVILLAGRLRGLVGSTGNLYEGALFLEDFTDFVEATPDRLDRPRASSSPRPFRSLVLEDVSFTYPSRTEPSLRDISLEIEHGEVIALVGENGSGKTTLTKLIAGLYRPSAGTLLWDGTDADDLDLAEVRRNVAVIFQDYARYFLTAHENVAISRLDLLHDTERVVDAARRAGADGFLSSLPDGYGSLLGPAFEGGHDLSIGQWQRIALARAYFRSTPILILDEPTAALDPRGEYEIFQQVRRLAEGHTVILVSHRFSSVRAADRILVLEEGRITEDGDHRSLLELGGRYAELYGLQAEGYRDAAP